MTALKGLLKKEVRLIRTTALAMIAGVLLYYAGLFVATRYFAPGDVAFYGILPMGVIMWLMPVVLMTSLGDERKKLHLWLHNPQAVWKLLGTKLVVALAVAAILLAIIVYGTYVFFATFLKNELAVMGDWRHFMLLGGVIFLTGSYVSLWFMFGWTVFHSIERYFKRLSLPITIGLLVSTIILLVMVETSSWFMLLGERLGMNIVLPTGTEASLEGASGSFQIEMIATPVNVLHLLYHIGIGSVLFFLSCRLIDRGVEV